MASDSSSFNYEAFRECFSAASLERVSAGDQPQRKAKSTKEIENRPPEVDAEDLAEFIEYLASETFSALPPELRSLLYSKTVDEPRLAEMYSSDALPAIVEDLLPRIPPTVTESISTYDLLPPSASFEPLLTAALARYVEAVASPPAVWSQTRASACEICARDWVRLTYHHLIPRQVHAKALKRKWHEPWRLNSVAWLCRACHDCVHRVASNEELARDFWTVDRLLEREDVRRWAAWAGRIRWKAK